MPLLRPSPSDFTAVVKALANAGAAVTNPQGFRPPSKSSVAFVNAAAVSSIITGSPFKFVQPKRAAPAPVTISLANVGSSDAFIVKYNSSGTPQWARRIGGTSSDRAVGIDTDSSGNIIVIGWYDSSPLTIYAADGTTSFTTLANAGSIDTFIVKYNSSGTPQWARRIGGTSSDAPNYPRPVAVDSNGDIVLHGTYSSTVSIYGSSASFTTLSNAGDSDSYIVKYNSSGTPQWARRIGGTSTEISYSIGVDSNGDIVVAGVYSSNPVSIYDSSASFTTLSNAGASDAYIVKYNSSGTPQWANKIDGLGNQYPFSLNIDSNRNIIVVGYYNTNSLSIYDGSASLTTLNHEGGEDAMIVKYNSSGTPQWARRIAGTASDYIYGIDTDSSGNIVVTGAYYSDTLTIYDTDGTTAFTTLSNNTQGGAISNTFVVKYNSSGTPQWARRIGGSSSDQGNALSIDSGGNIVVTGWYESSPLTIYAADGTTSFTTLVNTVSDNTDDTFIVKYNSSGTPQWARRIAGTSFEVSYSMDIDSNGDIVVAGRYTSNPLTITS